MINICLNWVIVILALEVKNFIAPQLVPEFWDLDAFAKFFDLAKFFKIFDFWLPSTFLLITLSSLATINNISKFFDKSAIFSIEMSDLAILLKPWMNF